jgi:WD40 repeat protein/tRNA A-37 threonylcarbamoyl transferase component Bud32
MLTTICPDAEKLAAFQAGRLKLEALNQIAAHVESCASCQAVMQNGSISGDALVRELRQAQHGDAFTDESGCQRAIARVEAMVAGAATHTHDDTASNVPAALLPMKMLGKYQLLEPIGQGGMGTVYKAVHTLLKRTVAVKVLPPNRLKDAQAVSRFRREIEAAGRLDHPHIVRTSDADEADGQHFLVMEWLAGQDLAKYVREHGPLPMDQACDFIRQAALGLECAHEHGMVHRDVKPANLLVTAGADGKPLVKVLDLGLALLHDNVLVENGLTSDGQVMGTYDYIAPEQAMESHTVDARADIYSLGCTFYFLLTGKAPFHGKSEAKKLLAHQLEEPAPLTKYRSDIPGAVVAVVTKMMAKDPTKRHGSMREIASCLSSAFGDAPSTFSANVSAVKSKRWPLVITASLAAGLVAVIALLAVIIHITTPEGDFVFEEFERKVPENQSVKLDPQKRVADFSKEPDAKEPTGKSAVGEVRRYLGHKDGVRHVVFSPDGKSFLSGSFGELWLWDVDSTTERVRFPNTQGFVGSAAFSLDGERVVGTAQVGSVVVWDAKTKPGEKVAELARFKVPGWAEWMALSPDRRHVFYTNRNGGRIYDLDKKTELPTRFVGDRASLSKNGRRLLSADTRTLYLWDVDTGKELSNVDCTASIFRVALAADGRHALAAVGNNVLQWDMDEKKQGKRLATPASVHSVAISPNGKRALTGGFDKKMRLWDLQTGMELYCFDGHTGPVVSVAFAPNGRQAISGSDDKTVRLWQLPTPVQTAEVELEKKGTPLLVASGLHSDGVAQLAVSRDGTKVLTYTSDNSLWFWEWDADKNAFRPRWQKKQDRGGVQSIALDPNGSQALVSEGANLRLSSSPLLNRLDTESEQIQLIRPGLERCGTVAISPDGRRYLVGDPEGFGILVFPKSLDKTFGRFGPAGELLRKFTINSPVEGNKNPVYQLCFSSDGERILSNGNDHTVRFWSSTAAEELKKLPRFAAAKKRFIALSPDGKQALISQDNEAQIWDLATGKSIRELTGHKDHVTAVAYGPDGSWAVSASQDKTLRVWDVATGQELAKLEGHTDDVTCVAVTSEGRIISGSRDKALRVWAWPK